MWQCYKITILKLHEKYLRIHWRLSTILEASNKSVWSNIFWYVKVCTKVMVQKIPFSWQAPTHHSFTFNLRFLYELKYKVSLSKTVCGIFHFRFRFDFIKVCIFVQQNTWTLWLYNVITSFKIKRIKKHWDGFVSRL